MLTESIVSVGSAFVVAFDFEAPETIWPGPVVDKAKETMTKLMAKIITKQNAINLFFIFLPLLIIKLLYTMTEWQLLLLQLNISFL